MEMLFSFTDPRFWFYFLYFLVTIVVAFYIPGNVFIRSQKFSQLQSIVLSFILGIVLFAFQGMLFGYLGIRVLSYLYLLGMVILWLRGTKFPLKHFKGKIQWKKRDPLLLLLILIGVSVQLVTVWFIGYRTNAGIQFCCFWPDSFYHLSLINELVGTFPPREPGMYDLFVRNYHFLANLVVAEEVRLFRLPLIHTQYQYMPVFLSFLLAFSVVAVGEMIQKGKSFTRWLVFLIFFSGDIIFLLLFFMGKGFDFTINATENATTLWFSPPRVYGMVILFGGILLFLSYLKKPNRMIGILLGLFLGSLVGFKIYLGFFALIGLGVVSVYSFLKKRFDWLIPLGTAGIITALLYLPINTGAGGLFYSGLWRIDDFAIRPIFGLMRLELAKQVYREHGNTLRIVIVEAIYFALYIFSLFGMFLLGFIQSKTSLKRFPLELHFFLLSGLIVSFVIGMFFLQETGGANTLQFLFSVYIVGAFYTALALSYWLPKLPRPLSIFLICVILVLVSARVGRETWMNIDDILKHKDYFVISKDEEKTLQYLDKKVPKDAVVAVDSSIATDDSCYILSVLAQRRFFLCGEGILTDHGVKTKDRVEQIQTISTSKWADQVAEIIAKNKISYFYVPEGFLFGTTQTRDFLIPVYKDGDGEILRVDQQKMDTYR